MIDEYTNDPPVVDVEDVKELYYDFTKSDDEKRLDSLLESMLEKKETEIL